MDSEIGSFLLERLDTFRKAPETADEVDTTDEWARGRVAPELDMHRSRFVRCWGDVEDPSVVFGAL